MRQFLEIAPKLSRSALHRCLQWHGISRQPAMPMLRRRGKFEETTLGSAHIDSAGMKISSGNWIAPARRPSSLRAVPSRSPVVRILPG
jgi:hypothetical protein